MSNRLRISLVIPAYNEESHLADCLRSALAQRWAFHEIIVVDNNSSDTTAAVARQFSNVTLLQETRQGIVYSRNRGFDTASGDVIARIDADTRIPIDWTEKLQAIFQDESIAAVTGSVNYYETSLAQTLSVADSILRRTVAWLLGPNMALQGANMALRRTAWSELHAKTCDRGGVHEDFDLAIHAVQQGQQVRYCSSLRAGIVFRQATSSWRTYASYYWHCPKTYLDHGVKRGRWLVPVATAMILIYPALHLLAKGYDAQIQRFSAAKFFGAAAAVRVNPATFAD